MQNLSVKKSIWKALKLVVLASALVAMGVFLISQNNSKSFVGWINVVFFGLSLSVGLYQLFDRRPQLIADENGFFDRMVLNESISWSSIESIRLKSNGFLFTKNHFAEIQLKPFCGENLAFKIKKRPFAKPFEASQPYVLNVTLSPLDGKAVQIIESLRTLKAQSEKLA